MLPADFLAAVAPAAQQTMRDLKVPASVTLAQAILESGWGTSGLSLRAMNLFGIKADASWTGSKMVFPTAEVVNGKRVFVSAAFRAYSTWTGSVHDHAQFLVANPRYAAAFQTTNGADFAHAIAKAGYATDPEYADKLVALMNVRNLYQYDKVA
jgi:flagellar rod assembly protein/muramidase FlgJ